MSNVVQFKQPPRQKEPKKLDPALRRVLIWGAMAAVLMGIWAWFHFTGGQGAPS